MDNPDLTRATGTMMRSPIDKDVIAVDHAIVVIGEKGGGGKSTLTDALVAALELAGTRTAVIDADGSNHGYLRRAGLKSAYQLNWGASTSAVANYIDGYLPGVRAVVVDSGANFLAAGSNASGFVSDLLGRLQADGTKILTAAVASTNAPGTDVLVAHVVEVFGQLGEVALVQNNVDGSGAFASGLTAIKVQKVTMAKIEAGFIDVRLQRVEKLADILAAPAENYVRATAALARATLRLVSQPPFINIVGPVAITELERLSAAAPGAMFYIVPTARMARDQALTANEALSVAIGHLADCDEVTAWSAVAAYREALTAYRALR